MCKDLNVNIKLDSYDLESNTKVVQNTILNQKKSTLFQLEHGIEMGVACDLNHHSS